MKTTQQKLSDISLRDIAENLHDRLFDLGTVESLRQLSYRDIFNYLEDEALEIGSNFGGPAADQVREEFAEALSRIKGAL